MKINRALLGCYQSLPSWARSIAATAHGLRLKRSRYGPETERLVEEAIEREGFSAAEWKRWREDRIARVIRRALEHVPYYRELWAKRRLAGDHRSPEILANWPVLSKHELHRNPRAFLADDCDPRRMFEDHTSGTSGTPLTLWRSQRTQRARYAIYEARHRRWYGVDRSSRWAMLGGQLVAQHRQARPPFWVWNAALRQLYVSSYHLSAELAPHALDELVRRHIEYLWGYPSSLDALARAALRRGGGPRMRVAVLNAEPVSPAQRERIEAAFACPARETYGMVELAAAGGECEHGRLHWFPEFGEVEHGSDGALRATSLLDLDMPLIRYDTGDRVVLTAAGTSCRCGRSLPLLGAVEGRADDLLVSSDGRPVGRLDPVFKADWPIRQAQIIQETARLVRVLYVPENGGAASVESALRRALADRLGNLDFRIEAVGEIPRGPNGKFRAVVSRLGEAGRAAALLQGAA